MHNPNFPHLDKDAPEVPAGKRPRAGVEYGCGLADCRDCYEDIPPTLPVDVTTITEYGLTQRLSSAVRVF